jgi:hypothetical protein
VGPNGEIITDTSVHSVAAVATAPSMRALSGHDPDGADAPREHGTELMAALTYNPSPSGTTEPKVPAAPPATAREAPRPVPTESPAPPRTRTSEQSASRAAVAPTEPPAPPPRTRTGEVSASRARAGGPPKTRTGEIRAQRRAMTGERALATQPASAAPAPVPAAQSSSEVTGSVAVQKPPRSSVMTALVGILLGVLLAGGAAVVGWFLLHH